MREDGIVRVIENLWISITSELKGYTKEWVIHMNK
ncbi:hypothetical protein CLAUR_001710 [Clostridium felsineum]|nr:hypothetical protein CLAUR_001710 [Clostridium felsineum]